MTHEDGTGRVQTAAGEQNERYYDLIARLRPPHRRARAAEYVVQRERAHRRTPRRRPSTASSERKMDLLVIGNRIVDRGTSS